MNTPYYIVCLLYADEMDQRIMSVYLFQTNTEEGAIDFAFTNAGLVSKDQIISVQVTFVQQDAVGNVFTYRM